MKMPDNVFYFGQCSQRSPSALLGKIAEKLGLSIKQRVSEIGPVVDALKMAGRKILIFDDMVLDNDIANFQRINMITALYDSTCQPIVVCGTNALHQRLFDDRWMDKYDHIRSRLIRQEMKGMSSIDAYNYLQMMQEAENICFTVNARQALAKIATEPKYAGIRKFTMIIGRITSKARANYYTTPAVPYLKMPGISNKSWLPARTKQSQRSSIFSQKHRICYISRRKLSRKRRKNA